MGASCTCLLPECSCDIYGKAGLGCPLHGSYVMEPPPRRPYYRVAEKRNAYVMNRGGSIHVLRPDTAYNATAYTPGLPVTFRVQLQNAMKIAVPKGAKLKLSDNGYFKEAVTSLPTIPPAGTYVASITAVPQRGKGATIKDLKPECILRVIGFEVEPLMKETFYLDAVDFAGNMLPAFDPSPKQTPAGSLPVLPASVLASSEIPQRTLNIYLVGGTGTGKTAFLQTVRSVLTDSAPPTASGKSLPATFGIECVDFSKLPRAQSLPPLPFKIFDTWGMDETTYTHGEMGPILRGEVPLGLRRGMDPSRLDDEQLDEAHLTKWTREAHAVLFFVAADEVEDNDRIAVMRSHLNVLKALGYKPMVVLNRIDLVEPLGLTDPFNRALDRVTHVRKRASQRLEVPWASTFIGCSYAAIPPTAQRHFHIDCLAVETLRGALHAAAEAANGISGMETLRGALAAAQAAHGSGGMEASQ